MKVIFSCFLVLIVTLSVKGQVAKDSELYKTILSHDSLFFNRGYNQCDIAQLELMLSDNSFEFYHDKGGMADKEGFITTMKNGLCKPDSDYEFTRKLIPETTKVYPLYNGKVLYGVLQEGEHKFYENLKGKEAEYKGTAKFTSLWLLENNEWKLSRVFSFGHR